MSCLEKNDVGVIRRGSDLQHLLSHVWHCFFLASLLCLGGCRFGVSDENVGEATTDASLRLWGEMILSAYEGGFNCETCSSAADALSWLKENGIAPQSYDKYLKRDYWGHAYRWKSKKGSDEINVFVISDGRNGLFEDGEGDDLWVKVRLPLLGRPHMQINRNKRLP